jgi:hypothetical protein
MNRGLRNSDGDVNAAELLLRRGEDGDNVGDLGEVTLNGEGIAASGFDVSHGFIRVRLGRRAVVVDADFRALGGEGAVDKSAQVLCAPADNGGFSLQ